MLPVEYWKKIIPVELLDYYGEFNAVNLLATAITIFVAYVLLV